MTDPILYLSMLLGLIGIYTLISSFGDDDDDNGGDGERYIYSLEFAKSSVQFENIKYFCICLNIKATFVYKILKIMQ